MYSITDEKCGIVLSNWKNEADRIKRLAPEFASLVNAVNPDDSFKLILAYRPYGELESNDHTTLFPVSDKDCNLIELEDLPPAIKKEISYDPFPLAMVLEKSMETFIDLGSNYSIIPARVYNSGDIFSFSRNLGNKNTHVPKGIFNMTSGSRSAFMLPNISANVHYANLQRDFNVTSSPPSSFYDHGKIFKEIVQGSTQSETWKSCVMYFSKKWIDKIFNDSNWLKIRLHLLDIAWKRFEHVRRKIHYDVAFSLIQKERNIRANPYLIDTFRHIISIGMGESLAYSPAVDESLLPAKLIQEAIYNSYGLKSYLPTIMQPSYLAKKRKRTEPVYYSLQNPSTYSFSPKTQNTSTTLTELREFVSIFNKISGELVKDHKIYSNDVLKKVIEGNKIEFFHNRPDGRNQILDSRNIAHSDDRFSNVLFTREKLDSDVATSSPFMRGCIALSNNGAS